MSALCILLGLAAAGAAQSSLTDNGRVVTLDDVSYYVGGVPVGQLGDNDTSQDVFDAASIPGIDMFPLTVVSSSEDEFRADQLRETVSRFEEEDDVFNSQFLRTVYLQSSSDGSPSVDATDLSGALEEMGTTLFITASGFDEDSDSFASASIEGDLAQGPYFVSTASRNIYKAHRLYEDTHVTFVQGVVSDEDDGYRTLPASANGVLGKSIAVPSRLYSTASDEKPLAGLRFGVKDIFHVKGVPTSGGNRAYYELYGPRDTTAPSVRRLIDLGAVLVGKMGTAQFANGDRPTADWIDLQAPFNPRGDGYQDPSGSSTGSGAGVGAYDWLDLALGSDTGGSVRGPAGANGVYGGRPSTGAISMDEVIPLSPVADTAGLFARSGALWSEAVHAYYPDLKSNYTSYPSTIYRNPAPGVRAPTTDPAVIEVIEEFYTQLEDFLQTDSLEANFTTLWDETHDEDSPTLQELMGLPYAVFITHDQWELVGKPFNEDYAQEHDGRHPYINPGPLGRWGWGEAFTNQEVYDQGLQNRTIFQDWWETEAYGRHDPESCSEGLYAYTFMAGVPTYRDTYVDQQFVPPIGFDEPSVPGMAGVPEVVVPVAEVPYESKITFKEEFLPISVALRMARGCDLVLADLVSDLEERGILRSVATGPKLYP